MTASEDEIFASDDEKETIGGGDASERISEIRRFRDPVHDYMAFGHSACAIIDTKQFQRLRHIKQLGTSYYVWPGASHNRFEHCLGVAHLAQTMVKHLQQSQPELGITDREVECVTIAGLCHDLGHGPWSHVWDSLFIPTALPGSTWKHEEGSEMLFDDLIQSNKLSDMVSEKNGEFIKDLIAGRDANYDKKFLFDIVANKRNGLDVDKFDYIARDSRAVDNQGFSSVTRLINSARVIDNQICYDIKDANQVYELCYTRFSLHKRIYNHKTAKAIEYMIVDALRAAEPHMKIAERIHDPNRFVYLTDGILTEIQASTSPKLAEARRICDRINRRDLYKPVDYKVFPWAHKDQCARYFTPERIVTAAKALTFTAEDQVAEKLLGELDERHVIVNLAQLHYGMGDKNPLNSVKFYSKRDPNSCRSAEPGDISLLMPAFFGEVLLRVYTRESRFFGLVQAGYRECLKMFDPETIQSSSASSSNASPPRVTVFANNEFTTVPKDFAPPLPGKGAKRKTEGSLGLSKRRAVSHPTAPLKFSMSQARP